MNPRMIYEKEIKDHVNYAFMPEECKKNWVSVSKNGVNPRKEHWEKKREEQISLGNLPKESTFANLAKWIHPTGKHICKKCNQECSIYFEYPTSNTWKWLKQKFNIEKNPTFTIFEIYKNLEHTTKDSQFEKYFEMTMKELESACKKDQYSKKKLSPGVMCNPPDRLDGFHCYNSICGCRKKEDKGRSDENMKSYTRDRRAYEWYSDGNCLLANALMGALNLIQSKCFNCGKNTQMSADHIGPISLGFNHDPVNFQACCSKCNSTKNNRLTQEDVAKIKKLEETGSNMISWWAKDAWEKIKNTDNETIKKILDLNAKKFIAVMEWLKSNKPEVLREYITQSYMNHTKAYKIDSINILSTGQIEFKHSEIVSEKKTKDKQYERTFQILLKPSNKNNRKVKVSLSENELISLADISLADISSADISSAAPDIFKNKICAVLAEK